MNGSTEVPLADEVRRAVEEGRWPDFDRLDERVVMRTSSARGSAVIDGRSSVSAHLARLGPGEVSDWNAREWPSGAAVTFQWHGEPGIDRRRWYLRTDPESGLVTGIWSYSARPTTADGAGEIPVGVVAALAPGGDVEPLAHGGNSGAALLRLRTSDGEALIVKRIEPGGDWLARVTEDEGRTGQLSEAGAFAEMDDLVEHGITAVTRAEGAWWVAMRDLSPHLLDDVRSLSREESRRVLAAAARIHDRFRNRPPAGLASLEARVGMSSPRIADVERASPDLLPKQFEFAWEAFADAVPSDVADPVLALATDPRPLAEALRAAAPLTLLHGDLRDDNLGFDGERMVLLDWDLATAGTPTVEFAWYLMHDAWRIDATHDEIEADYRAAEAELNPDEIELGMLSGLVQYGWVLGHSAGVHPDPAETAWARGELDWWTKRVRRALELWGGAPSHGSPES